MFYFTPLPGFFSPFLHSTGSLSVIRQYLGLEDGPPVFPADFTCPQVLWIPAAVPQFRLPGYHRLWPGFPSRLAIVSRAFAGPNPGVITNSGLASFAFARRYSQNLV